MKFSLSWLKQHLDTDADAAAIADTLTAIGLEVEGLEDPAEALAPFRQAFERPADDPAPLPYLDSPANRKQGAIDAAVEALA